VPLALVLLAAMPRTWSGASKLIAAPADDALALSRAASVLKWTTVLLLFGHGALGAIGQKALLTGHYAAIGLPASATVAIGWFEIALAFFVAVRPFVSVLLVVVAWKLATEWLFVVAGAPTWEFVERAGSYAAPLALAAILFERNTRNPATQ
jgi:hypothetical protein